MHNFVNVDTIGVGFLFVVTIAASVQEDFVLFVLLRVQHVIAAELCDGKCGFC